MIFSRCQPIEEFGNSILPNNFQCYHNKLNGCYYDINITNITINTIVV